jgi:hypothetical protein
VLEFVQGLVKTEPVVSFQSSVKHQLDDSIVAAGTTLRAVVKNRYLQIFFLVFDHNFWSDWVVVAGDGFVGGFVRVISSFVQFSFDLLPSVGIRVEDFVVWEVFNGKSCDDLFT